MKMETVDIKNLIKREIDGEKDELHAQIYKFKQRLGVTEEDLSNELEGTKNDLIESNNNLNKNISSGIDEVQSKVASGLQNLMQNVSSNLTNVKSQVKDGLGGVNTGVGDTQKASEDKQESVRAALESVVNNQVSKLLDQIKVMNEANAKQQAKN